MSLLVDRAVAFAAMAHAGQRRKYTGLPYIIHPVEVMQIVHAVPSRTEEMLAAAVLHDVLEDCPQVSLDQLINNFGPTVAQLVLELTEVRVPGNRAQRKAAEVERLSKVSPEAQTIKVADLISNTSDITQHDRGFARVYLEEKAAVLSVLRDADTDLHNDAYEQLQQARASL